MRKYLHYLRKHGWKYTLNRLRIYLIRFPYVSDKQLLKAINEWRLFRKYRHAYRNILRETEFTRGKNTNQPLHIWSLWLQGEENAPKLVKHNFARIRKIYGKERLTVLDSKTIGHYIALPEYIVRKHENGNISHAHFSDIVRAFLLSEYGGCWIDSTCYLSAPIPKSIQESRFFIFKMPLCWGGAIKSSNWFIVCHSQNEIIVKVRKMLVDYWSKNNRIEDYLLFHIFISIVADSSEEAQAIWQEMPYFNNDSPHVLGRELNDEYKEGRFEDIMRMSFIHKLSNKADITVENSMFRHIIDNEENI